MDKFDAKLLNLVQQNNRLTSDEIAHQIGLSATAVQRRLKKLRNDGTIKADVSVVEPGALGKPMSFIVEVTLERESVSLFNDFKQQMKNEPDVQQCYYISGRFDFILMVYMKDMEEYEAFTQRVFFDNANVRRFETSVIMNRVKVGLSIPIDEGEFEGV